MATASDNFNRANGGLGANWTTPDAAAIVSNAFGISSGNAGHGLWAGISIGADQFSQATIVTLSADGEQNVRVRFGISSGYYRGGFIIGINSGNYVIHRVSSSMATTSQAPQVGDVVRLEITGAVVTLYVNGIQIAQATDGSPLPTANPGLVVTATNISPGYWDNWSGGDLTTASVDAQGFIGMDY